DIAEAFVLPWSPEVGRTTVGGRQMIGGVPVHETAFALDPQNPVRDASVPRAIEASSARRAAVVGLDAVRDGVRFASSIVAARDRGASVVVCDGETDADLERAVRGLLSRPRPLLLVGSIGLARALRRGVDTRRAARTRPLAPAPPSDGGVLMVVGSAHPVARAQVARAAGRGMVEPIVVHDAARAEAAGTSVARILRGGRAGLLVSPEE